MTADLDVSRETLDALERYAELLRKWNPSINLVSKASIGDLWTRHIVDSAQIYRLGGKGDWVDIGSGGGFPGLVVAVLARERSPERVITLVESDVRKSAFLRTVSQDLSLNTRVLAKRIEDISPLKADILSARALADLPTLLGYAARHLNKTGKALFMKGASWEKEVEDARSLWSFDLRVHKSKTHPEAAILELKDIQRA